MTLNRFLVTDPAPPVSVRGRTQVRLSCILAYTLALVPATFLGAIPEPDNLLYGSIAFESGLVTAGRDDVVVEARRSDDDSLLASYRMGADSLVGNLYSLAIPLDSGAETASGKAAQSGESLRIVVRDATGPRFETDYVVGERGEILRLDFGDAVPDADGNSLPDAWEIAHFGSIGQDPQAINANGRTTRENFLTGNDPHDPESRFGLIFTLQGDQRVVLLAMRSAVGPGYEGTTRLYTLESSPDLVPGSWTPVPGYADVAAADETLIYATPRNGPAIFYRATARLVGP